jgi:salicylate hydroxylase
MRIGIIGAGIGGLAAATALMQAGHHVTVFEQAGQLGEVGAGLQLSPNATRILARWGVLPAVQACAVAPMRTEIRRWDDDRLLAALPLGEAVARRFGSPYLNVYRPDLIDVLRRSAAAAELRLGLRVEQIALAGNEVRLVLPGGAELRCDLLIGADGVHSTVRTTCFENHPARFGGVAAYRATIERSLLDERDRELIVTSRLGPGRHIVAYFVGRDARLCNVVAVVPATWSVESWHEQGDADELRAQFAGWSPAAQRLLRLVGDPVFRWALYDRTPLDQWVRGRIALLGDACHPMLPFQAQGACQAIEDAEALAWALPRDGDARDLAAGLAWYETCRRSRTAPIQAQSWALNEMNHLPDGPEQRRRDESLAAMTADASLDMRAELFGHVVAAPV